MSELGRAHHSACATSARWAAQAALVVGPRTTPPGSAYRPYLGVSCELSWSFVRQGRENHVLHKRATLGLLSVGSLIREQRLGDFVRVESKGPRTRLGDRETE